MATNTPGAKPLTRPLGLVSTLAISIALSGCATPVQWLASKQDSSILNPATVQQPRTADGLNPFSSKESKGSDLDKPANTLRGDPDKYKPDGKTECSETPKNFMCLQQDAAKDPYAKLKAVEYLSSGITLSNELCNNWFDKLYITQISLRQTSDLISSSGALTSAILGFSEADSQTVGLVASVFGFGKQTTDSLNANYVVAADLTTLAAAVREYRAGYAKQLDDASPVWNYYTARRAIMAYDNTCSALAVKRFVNSRVSGVKSTEVAQPLFEQTLKVFIDEWGEKFESKPTVDLMSDIYAYLYLKGEAPTAVETALEASLKKKYPDLSKILKAPENAATLRISLMRSSLDAYLERLARQRLQSIELTQKAEAEKKSEGNATKNITAKSKNITAKSTSLTDDADATQPASPPQPSTSPPEAATAESDAKPLTLESMPTAPSGRPLDQAPQP